MVDSLGCCASFVTTGEVIVLRLWSCVCWVMFCMIIDHVESWMIGMIRDVLIILMEVDK